MDHESTSHCTENGKSGFSVLNSCGSGIAACCLNGSQRATAVKKEYGHRCNNLRPGWCTFAAPSRTMWTEPVVSSCRVCVALPREGLKWCISCSTINRGEECAESQLCDFHSSLFLYPQKIYTSFLLSKATFEPFIVIFSRSCLIKTAFILYVLVLSISPYFMMIHFFFGQGGSHKSKAGVRKRVEKQFVR